MTVREIAGFSAILCSGVALVLGCAHAPPMPQPAPKVRVVVVRGNIATPVHCSCEDAERRARAWKTYAIKLEAQLGIPAAASSGDLP